MRKTTLFVTLLRNSDEITVCDDGTSFVLSGSYCNEEEFEYKYFFECQNAENGTRSKAFFRRPYHCVVVALLHDRIWSLARYTAAGLFVFHDFTFYLFTFYGCRETKKSASQS